MLTFGIFKKIFSCPLSACLGLGNFCDFHFPEIAFFEKCSYALAHVLYEIISIYLLSSHYFCGFFRLLLLMIRIFINVVNLIRCSKERSLGSLPFNFALKLSGCSFFSEIIQTKWNQDQFIYVCTEYMTVVKSYLPFVIHCKMKFVGMNGFRFPFKMNASTQKLNPETANSFLFSIQMRTKTAL